MGIRRNKTMIEQAADYVEAAVESAREKAGPAIADAIEKAGPMLADAKDKAAPVIADAPRQGRARPWLTLRTGPVPLLAAAHGGRGRAGVQRRGPRVREGRRAPGRAARRSTRSARS